MLDSILHNVKSVNTEQDGSDIPKVQSSSSHVRRRTLTGGVFLIERGVFRGIVAFSGVSLVSAGPEATDFRLGGCPASA